MLLLMKKRYRYRIFHISRLRQTLSDRKPERQHMEPIADKRKSNNFHREGHAQKLYSKERILRQRKRTA